ncbi:MAG: hypothetical protein ACTS8Z_06430 [Candidatus Limnocylindrales bacterium]
MQRPGDDQPTVFSEGTKGATAGDTRGDLASDAPSEVAAADGTLSLPPEIARRTGVVFVHGIGTQTPAETFLDWSTPVIELLTDWRAAQPRDPDGRIDDPVWRAEFSFNAASPPYLEVSVPAHAGIPTTTWVVTEAWWAADLRAPSLGRTIDYLRRRMGMVVKGIAQGYRDRTPRLHDLAIATDLIGHGTLPLDWRLIERLDLVQSKTFGARPVGWLVGGIGAIVLAGYDLLRRIPISAIRDFAAKRMIDSFLVDWFGDLPVLLDDAVQSANVRARLARSIERLKTDGCDAIVIVAHSGGALVSFETLLDPAYAHLKVDKLITLGQGLGLAWRLAADPDVHDITPGSRLVGNLAKVRPGLRWVDVWASYDPAPAGPLPERSGLRSTDAAGPVPMPPTTLVASGAAEASPKPVPPTETQATAIATGDKTAEPWLMRSPVPLPGQSTPTPPVASILIESRPVTNEMNVLTDHGAYWANPEGFLIPLVRHLDAARGDARASRFYRDTPDRTRRIVWRRQRVSALAAWGWLCSLGAIVTSLLLIALQAAGDRRLTRAGDAVAAAWDLVPGSELIAGPVSWFGSIIGGLFDWVGLTPLARGFGSLGPVVLAIGLTLGLFFALVKVGLARWHDWDVRERRAMHPETPVLPDRSSALGQALLLVGGLIGLILATFGWGPAAAVVIVLAAAAGLIVWIQRPFRTTPVAAPD